MGATNNSLIRISDVVGAGGVRNTSSTSKDANKNTSSTSKDANRLIKDKDITKGTDEVNGPLFYNVTLKNEYGDTHLTKFQDLEIAETYPVTLKVSLPTTAWTAYTLYGFTATVSYPNGTSKSKLINQKVLSTDKDIEIENCCDNAKIKVLSSSGSGAAISSDGLREFDADVAINSLFTEGDGLVCTELSGYPCFTLTKKFTPIDPVDPSVPTRRKIDIVVTTSHLDLYRVLIITATYCSGSTLQEVQNHSTLIQTSISKLENKEITDFGHSTTVTINVPRDAYVAVYLSDPSASPTNMEPLSQYRWIEDNWQYVSPGTGKTSVTYTINTSAMGL